MLPILGILLLSQLCYGHDAVTSSPRLACNSTYLCSEADRQLWLQKRDQAKRIRRLIEISKIGAYVLKENLNVLEARNQLCADINTGGFLFNNESDHWPMACLSVGNSHNSTCSPAPPMDEVFNYMKASQWRDLLRNARQEMGCSASEVVAVQEVSELYVCRERCTHSGIGYFQSLLIMLGVFMTLITLNMN
ncbi:unnamed protein product [Bursaphelenchus okinawaensis]|uniref:Uncharacterized protein n=1 Tax=Bursaphelenchus okinawaensis TaxID=465554 RepID=A0A811LKX8_9BILA|nr:unnamed protein product [Bursaphelenchus okinawaensis]CAG9125880.1 unnamed protein product [Bursaphelenchus okinawaensis]